MLPFSLPPNGALFRQVDMGVKGCGGGLPLVFAGGHVPGLNPLRSLYFRNTRDQSIAVTVWPVAKAFYSRDQRHVGCPKGFVRAGGVKSLVLFVLLGGGPSYARVFAGALRSPVTLSSRPCGFCFLFGRWNFHKLLVDADGDLAGVSKSRLCP